MAAVLAGQAQAADEQRFRVLVDRDLTLAEWHASIEGGAVGLLVPGAGPRTSERAALAMLERGVVANSLRDPVPSGPARIEVELFTGRRERPSRGDRLILVGLPQGGDQPNDRRYPVVVVGDDFHGLLTSDSTRIPGLVSIADIAPTALGQTDGLGSEPSDDPISKLRALDERIDEHNSWRSRTATWLELVLVALAGVSASAALLGYAGLLVANVVLGAVHVPPLAALLLLAAAAAGGLVLARVVRRRPAVALVLASVIAVYLVSFAVDERWVALSPLGPTQNARFYGISNLLETLLLVPALAAAALLARPLAVAAVAALAVLTVAGSRFGADGGGAVVLAVGFAVLATLMAGASRRAVVLTATAAVALVLALVGLDAATGASSHVTRALEDGLADDLSERVTLSWKRATANASTGVTTALGIAALAALDVRLVRLRGPLEQRALPLAFAAAIATSMVVNDSPKDVILAGLVGYVTVEAFALGRDSAAGRARALVASAR